MIKVPKTRRGKPCWQHTLHWRTSPLSQKKRKKKTLHVTRDLWHVTCDMWHMEGGEHSFKKIWLLADTVWEWRWHVTHDMWYVTCDMWHGTHDTWHMTHDTWHMTCYTCMEVTRWTFSLGHTDWDWRCFEDILTKGWLNDWINELITKVFVEQPLLHRVC